jgi:tetratricopeptide (TPR) repeat protein
LAHRKTVSFRYLSRAVSSLAAVSFLAILVCPPARGGDKDKDKDKPEKEKKEKIEPWVEVRSAHFIVASDGGEKMARKFADEFESLLRVFKATMPNARLSTGVPVRILVSRDGPSFGRMAPEFPYDKRREQHEQPPGLMFSGTEKTYIGIRANTSGRFPYIEIFQNFAREILKRSYRNLPPWIEEGYSTVYGSLTFSDRGIRLERPDPEDLSVLFESPLLPLDLVLHVDRSSGYYSPGDKGSVYFAESRVLLHYLISDPQYASSNSIARYVTAVQGGADSLQAARDAFGDLNQLQGKLDGYIKNVSGPAADIPLSGGGDSGGSPRMLTPAEIEARTADFMALRGKSEDAEDKLNEALMAEPSLAEAEQSLGYLMLKRDDLDEAQKHFDHAAQLDPKDALNFYGQGMVAIAQAGKSDVPLAAAAHFEKAVALSADFAPAWYSLATVYAQHAETLPKALDAAKHAAVLSPGVSSYQLQVSNVQDQISHPEEARRTASRVQPPGDNRTSARADSTSRISPRQAPPPPSDGQTSRPNLRIENKTETDTKTASNTPPVAPPNPAPTSSPAPSSTPAPTSAPAPAPSSAPAPAPASSGAPAPPLFSESKNVYSMVGTITDVNCASAPQVQVTLKSQTIVMKLHAESLEKLAIKLATAGTAAKGTTCASLRGRNARISYLFVEGKPWDAEMQTVEFR